MNCAAGKIRKGETKMIKFRWQEAGNSDGVYLDGKKVGEIKEVDRGWQYFPKGQKDGGEVFKNISDCRDSLSGE